MALFSWTPLITTDDTGVVTETDGHLTCDCGSVLKKNLDAISEEKVGEMFDSISINGHVALTSVYTGTLNCTSCKIHHISCKITKFGHSYCATRKSYFKVFSRKGDAAEVGYLKITAERPHSVHKDPLVIYIPLGRYDEKTEDNTVDIISKQSNQSHPKVIDIPIGGLKYETRHLRQVTHCLYPHHSETSAIKCLIYPSSVKCVQKCAFGYTFKHGISRELHCNFKEDKWMPSGFKECQPFVDCSVTLISGGSSNCTSMSLTKGPECKIECLKYEDKEAVPEASYSCDINGNWTPKLPFCAVSKSEIVLAKVPQKKTHNETDEE